LATVGTNWLEPLSPHVLDYGMNPAFRRKGSVCRAGATADAMRVRQVMSTDFITASPDTSVGEIALMLIEKGVGAVPVVDAARRLVGIVSDGDLIQRAEIGTQPRRSLWRSLLHDARSTEHEYVRTHGRTAADVMTHAPVTTTESALLHKVAAVLARRFKQMPVVRDDRLVGMISSTDLVRKLASHVERIRDGALRERVIERTRSLPWNMSIRAVNTVVEDGVATVYGWAGSDIERRALQVVVENTPGVLRAEDRLSRVPPYI
jgi:CBS domain-containing protein